MVKRFSSLKDWILLEITVLPFILFVIEECTGYEG